jgi:hypothetical protein
MTPDLPWFRTSVTFEFDLKPVETVRLEFQKDSFENAFKTAVFQAWRKHPRLKPRSMVAVVELIATPTSTVSPQSQDPS